MPVSVYHQDIKSRAVGLGARRVPGSLAFPSRTTADAGESRSTARHKILVVEDNMILALQIEDALLDAGFEVIGVATTSEQAVALATQHRPALALMDIRLASVRDGIDTAVELLQTLGIRSVFASAHSAPEMRERANAAKPAGWLVKPYTMEQMVGCIRQSLRGT